VRLFRAAAVLSCAASLTLLAGACGSGSTSASGGATLAPASTAVFVAIDTDSGGDQWQAAEALLDKFPGGSDLIAGALQSLEGENLDYATDIEPALGPETDVVLLDLSASPVFVLLTQPDDSAKFEALVESGDEPGVVTEVEDGWWAAAESQEVLDRFAAAREAGDPLADSDPYNAAIDKLPEDALATIYVDPSVLTEAAGSAQSEAVPFDQGALAKCLNAGQSSEDQSLAFALTAEEGGVRLNGVGTGAIPAGEAAAVTLDEFFPGDALAFVDAQGFGDAFQKSLDCISEATPELNQGLAQLQLALGTSVEELLSTLFGGELGVAVYGPGALGAEDGLNPVVIVATEVDDEGQALDMVTGLFDRAGLFTGGELALGDASVDGMEAKSVIYQGNAVAYFGTLDGKLVVSTTEAGLSALSAGDSTLAEDATYTSAQEASGVPGDTASLVYVNLQDAVGLAGAALATQEAAPDVLANVKPLKSLMFWSEGPDGDTSTFEAFLQID
jgi:hypothetical protein